MLEIDGNDLSISKSEDIPISFKITGATISEDDIVIFVVRKSIYADPIIQKSYTGITDNILLVDLTNEDTDIEIRSYIYEISIKWADGKKNKIFNPHKFTIKGGDTIG